MSKQKLQISLNNDLGTVQSIIGSLPADKRIILEAGTSFIKRYGSRGISLIKQTWKQKVGSVAYVVADLKCMDRGGQEIFIAKNAGADAATVLGTAPVETLNEFIEKSAELGIDAIVDMLNVTFPFEILGSLKTIPPYVMLHLGVEERLHTEKQIPYQDCGRIKGSYTTTIAIAGGETPRDVRRVFFNGGDIAVIWEAINTNPRETTVLANQFLSTLKI
ncbi:MAG: hypothetical protein UX65_C0001G0048 [Parcubacteria group bacterium GW2011_GWB1_46_8]|nr:MAG: hypothetical protein UX14_C0003G0014 [Parcubacteria group bacterium GW2011_GWF1_45_5]KKU11171.1 MAG: hypothetical protein UX15_C0014G0005 [Parcubacteria group bacterium GW2011_GWA1_45_7]KKU43550.1 MAG: hypothetical protein UX61_C0016G0002 [Parcubacteria group bacterium GW2011_GWA2_46_7]KKU46654.1 MAG: hypothetical protein UX65_C0001G0048 [Parcubacteria group bacterium GW2011_GWB1_46_8]KKU47780.1 MAG: hypothetical protein UX66_C0005G0002 [Parcubacteria group bacterium GW2011_GWF2_46_8]